MYFATQLFSLSVISSKNWLLDLGFMWQDVFISDKNRVKCRNPCHFLLKKSVKPGTVLIETVLFGDSLHCSVYICSVRQVNQSLHCKLWKADEVQLGLDWERKLNSSTCFCRCTAILHFRAKLGEVLRCHTNHNSYSNTNTVPAPL